MNFSTNKTNNPPTLFPPMKKRKVNIGVASIITNTTVYYTQFPYILESTQSLTIDSKEEVSFMTKKLKTYEYCFKYTLYQKGRFNPFYLKHEDK